MQINATLKGNGGAVGLTDNPSALRRWVVEGPELASFIEQFHDESNPGNRPQGTMTRLLS